MFGMEKKKAKPGVFLFDVEKELQETPKQKEYAKLIEEKINKIHDLLRKGSKKEDFDQLGILLNGYHAMAVVFGRAASLKKGSSK